MHTIKILALGALVFGLFHCSSSTSNAPAAAPDKEVPSLKMAFADNFLVGCALAPKHIDNVGMRGKNLVMREYNTITPENIMKWEEINPAPGEFNWKDADDFVQFGEDNDMFIVGHALVWHSQLSSYVKGITGREEMLAAMKAHIDAVAGRYKGRVHAWDVVNEALNEDGSLRESEFYKVLGEDYLAEAFKMAAAAAGPETKLYYNDYNMWNADKREGAIRMIEKIRAAGGRVDGIGMQAHYRLPHLLKPACR